MFTQEICKIVIKYQHNRLEKNTQNICTYKKRKKILLVYPKDQTEVRTALNDVKPVTKEGEFFYII